MNQNNDVPESQGDELAALIRNEVGNQVKVLRNELMPNGVGGLMNEIVDQVANKIIPLLPSVDTDEIAQKAYELARGQMTEQAQKIGAEIESKAASANNGAGGMGPGAPTANGHEGHEHGEGDGGAPLPPGYTFTKVNGASNMAQAMKMQFAIDPIGILNMMIDKVFFGMERWVKMNKDPNDVETLTKIQQRAPQLFGMYVPNPWGPEFQRMQMETWNTAIKTKMGNYGEQTPPGVVPLNPLLPGAPPSGGYYNVSAAPPQTPSVVPGWPTVSGVQPTAPMTPEYVTPSGGPKTMAEMLGGD